MLTALYVVLALISAYSTIRYFVVRAKATHAFGVLIGASGADVSPAAQTYWGLDRIQKRFGVACISTYAILMALNIYFESTPVRIAAMAIGICSFISILIAAEFHNTRQAAIRMARQRD